MSQEENKHTLNGKDFFGWDEDKGAYFVDITKESEHEGQEEKVKEHIRFELDVEDITNILAMIANKKMYEATIS